MAMLKIEEYPAEIERVKKIISNGRTSEKLRSDMQKYLRRLYTEQKQYNRFLRGERL